jgi:hypothetical protein
MVDKCNFVFLLVIFGVMLVEQGRIVQRWYRNHLEMCAMILLHRRRNQQCLILTEFWLHCMMQSVLNLMARDSIVSHHVRIWIWFSG